MDLNTFQQKTCRTMPFGGSPTNKVECDHALLNYACGLVGEWHELSHCYLTKAIRSKELLSELGDVTHYAVGLLTFLCENYDSQKILTLSDSYHIKLEQHLANILEIPKKHVFHLHELDRDKLIDSVYYILSVLLYNFGSLVYEAAETNIEKLKIRYPDKFSAENSIARVDVVEVD